MSDVSLNLNKQPWKAFLTVSWWRGQSLEREVRMGSMRPRTAREHAIKQYALGEEQM
jgi:hypothetical protein